jgi:hypothetical protein
VCKSDTEIANLLLITLYQPTFGCDSIEEEEKKTEEKRKMSRAEMELFLSAAAAFFSRFGSRAGYQAVRSLPEDDLEMSNAPAKPASIRPSLKISDLETRDHAAADEALAQMGYTSELRRVRTRSSQPMLCSALT